jgi:hypothetical protein
MHGRIFLGLRNCQINVRLEPLLAQTRGFETRPHKTRPGSQPALQNNQPSAGSHTSHSYAVAAIRAGTGWPTGIASTIAL